MQVSNTPPGRIIMMDGPDGVGKTEQVRLLAQALQRQNRDVYVSRVHGGTPIGEKLRDVSLSGTPRTPYTDLFISRAIHAELAKELHEKRDAGTICLVDRSPASMWAYQVRASGLPEPFARPHIQEDFAMFAADLVVVYEASLSVLQQRLAGREGSGQDYFESKSAEYHEWVIIGYSETAELFGTKLVDASGTIEAVHQKTLSLVSPLVTPAVS